LLGTFLGPDALDLKKANLPNAEKTVMHYLSFALVWSLGANLHDASRATFGDALRAQMRKRFPEFPDGDVYEYGIDAELHKLAPWSE